MVQERYLNVSYKIDSSENFEAYLEKTGIPENIRNLVLNDDNATILFTKDGDSYSVHTTSKIKDDIMTFTPGEEFEHTAPHGKTYKGVITINGDKISHISSDNPSAAMSMEFQGEQLVLTLKEGNCVATRIYKRV